MKNIGNIGIVTITFEPTTERLIAALLSEDDVGSIIRTHTEIERAVDSVLVELTGNRYSPKGNHFKYLSEKVTLLGILGVPEDFLAPLKLINRHRNEFTHHGQDAFSEKEVLELARAVRKVTPKLDDDFRMIVRGLHSFDKSFADCTNRERYVIAATLMLGLIAGLPKIIEKAAAH